MTPSTGQGRGWVVSWDGDCSADAAPSPGYVRSMADPTCSGVPGDLPAPSLATCDRLPEEHARLRSRGVHERAGGWVIARPDDVVAALTSPVMSAAVPVATRIAPTGAARALQARMARFSDGEQHTRRRGLLEQLLPEAEGLHAAARGRSIEWARGRVDPWDVMPLARSVPVLVLADALGVPATDVPRVGELVGRLCTALGPTLGPPASAAYGDEAAERLTALLEPVGPWNSEQTAAAAGLLFQARDATAALIGTALLHGASATAVPADPEASVQCALRRAAPVQCTRRIPVESLTLGGVTVPGGSAVWIVLAAAEQGAPALPATFGDGPHACPGAEHAVALAGGVLAGLHAAGWRPIPGQPVGYEPRPNLRMPSAAVVQHA